MPYFHYANAILGTQSTINGAAHDYNFAPAVGSSFVYSGAAQSFGVFENDPAATQFNGDTTNETVDADKRVGQFGEQSTDIGGTQSAIVFDYAFQVTDGTSNWWVAVIDVDLNNDGDLNDAGEDGYFLTFIGGMPPADTSLTRTSANIFNPNSVAHATLEGKAVCFGAGTLIETATGPRAVETLAAGDLIRTLDSGLRPLAWTGGQAVSAMGSLAPVVFEAGAVGNARQLVVSPQHRMLVEGWRAELLFGAERVLVPAKALVNGRDVRRCLGRSVEYRHLMFEGHEVIIAEGALSESLHPGPVALHSVGRRAAAEIHALYPEIAARPEAFGPTAYPALRTHEGMALAA